MIKTSWWGSSEFGAKSNRLPDFIFDTLLFGAILYFSRFNDFVFERRLLMSLLAGLGLAFVAGLSRYLLKPRVDLWKASIKKRRAEKSNSLNNLG
jgi:hypothetical protein